MLCDKNLPLIRQYVDKVVRETPDTSPSVSQLVNLYDRCQFFESNIHRVSLNLYYFEKFEIKLINGLPLPSLKMQLSSFNKIIPILVANYPQWSWEFICKTVEIAISYYPQSYAPTKEVIFLMRVFIYFIKQYFIVSQGAAPLVSRST